MLPNIVNYINYNDRSYPCSQNLIPSKNDPLVDKTKSFASIVLLSMPEDILAEIMLKAQLIDIAHIRETCQTCNQIATSSPVLFQARLEIEKNKTKQIVDSMNNVGMSIGERIDFAINTGKTYIDRINLGGFGFGKLITSSMLRIKELSIACPHLNEFYFYSPVEDEAIIELTSAFSRLKVLRFGPYLGYNHSLEDKTILEVVKNCKLLQEFETSSILNSPLALEIAKNLTNLRKIKFSNSSIEFVQAIMNQNHNLKSVRFDNYPSLNDEFIDFLPQNLPTIRGIFIENSQITDEGLAKISIKFPNLQIIEVKSDLITIEGVKSLMRCPNLKNIALYSSSLTDPVTGDVLTESCEMKFYDLLRFSIVFERTSFNKMQRISALDKKWISGPSKNEKFDLWIQ